MTDVALKRAVDEPRLARRIGVKNNADFEARKLIVLRAAAAAFCEKGYSRTSIDDIAATLGVTKPTIYYYARSKDDLVLECLRLGMVLLTKTLDEFESRHLNGLQKIEALFDQVTNSITEDFARMFVSIDPKVLSDEVQAEFAGNRRALLHSVTKLVKEGVADGTLAVQDPELTAYTLTGAFNFIGQWYRPGGRRTPADISRGTLEIFLNGIRGPAATSARTARGRAPRTAK